MLEYLLYWYGLQWSKETSRKKESTQKTSNRDFLLLSAVCVWDCGVHCVVSQSIYVSLCSLHWNVMWCLYWYTDTLLQSTRNKCMCTVYTVQSENLSRFYINELNRLWHNSTYQKINGSHLYIILRTYLYLFAFFADDFSVVALCAIKTIWIGIATLLPSYYTILYYTVLNVINGTFHTYLIWSIYLFGAKTTILLVSLYINVSSF